MNFVLNRKHVLASTLGHAIAFEKGVPQYVPPALYSEAVSIGAVPEHELEQPTHTGVVEPQEPHLREAALFAAFETLVLANKSGDFTAGGAPRDKAMERVLGWPVDAKETGEIWKKFKVGSAQK